MNSKGIKKHLSRKVDDWIETIEDEEVKNLVIRDAINKKKESDENFKLDNHYLFEVINRVF